jgi:glyoxylase-like metal-dependent hydrolase (beta-lactamase superfamily II)
MDTRAPEKTKASFRQARTTLVPSMEKGPLKTFDGEAELYPGIRAWPHPGHNPGHTFYVVESKDQKPVLLGDTVHATHMQFPRPDIALRSVASH